MWKNYIPEFSFAQNTFYSSSVDWILSKSPRLRSTLLLGTDLNPHFFCGQNNFQRSFLDKRRSPTIYGQITVPSTQSLLWIEYAPQIFNRKNYIPQFFWGQNIFHSSKGLPWKVDFQKIFYKKLHFTLLWGENSIQSFSGDRVPSTVLLRTEYLSKVFFFGQKTFRRQYMKKLPSTVPKVFYE